MVTEGALCKKVQGESVFDMVAFITHHRKKQSVPKMNIKLLQRPERKDQGSLT